MLFFFQLVQLSRRVTDRLWPCHKLTCYRFREKWWKHRRGRSCLIQVWCLYWKCFLAVQCFLNYCLQIENLKSNTNCKKRQESYNKDNEIHMTSIALYINNGFGCEEVAFKRCQPLLFTSHCIMDSDVSWPACRSPWTLLLAFISNKVRFKRWGQTKTLLETYQEEADQVGGSWDWGSV